MQIHTGVYWSARRGHNKNQDSLSLQQVSLQRGECLLAVVCDGIGSLEGAEDAGSIVVSRLTDWFYHEGKELIYQKASKEKILLAIQEQIFQIQEFLQYFQQKEQIQTGTTCSGLLIIRNRYYLIHIGDSRIYQFQRHRGLLGQQSCKIRCLTEDDHDERGFLKKALGLAGTDKAIFRTGKIKGKTGFLLCTDGFYRGNEMGSIGKVLGTLLRGNRRQSEAYEQQINRQLERRLELLGKASAENGSRDDMSAIGILIR